MQVTWKKVGACQDSLPTNSLVHAAYTTMYGRLELYNVLAALGPRALYCDTDSAVFVSRPGEPDPPLGRFLGQLTDEMEAFGKGSYISEFVSAGANAYALKVACGGDLNKEKIIMRLKGVSLNSSTADTVNFDKFKALVLEDAPPAHVHIPAQIARVAGWQLVTRPASKIWQANLNKRKLCANGVDTEPFGYQAEQELDAGDLETLACMMDIAAENAAA